jgi:hypothetical protein
MNNANTKKEEGQYEGELKRYLKKFEIVETEVEQFLRREVYLHDYKKQNAVGV